MNDGSKADPGRTVEGRLDPLVAGMLERYLRSSEQRDTLEGRADRAEHNNRNKSLFFASMAHDLRTPLNSIIGFSEMLADQLLGPLGMPKYVEYAGDIRASSLHLLRLIDDLLDLSKLEAGRLDVHTEPMDVRRLLVDLNRTLAPVALTAGNTLAVATDGDMGRLVTDPVRSKQVLINLLGNAIKFTPQGGRIDLGFSHRAREGSDWAVFTVSDTGIGLTAEQLDKVFNEYEQADPMTAENYGGTGLGLHISRRLAAMLGGFLEAESKPGAGSEFRLFLPLDMLAAGGGAVALDGARRLTIALDRPVTCIDPHFHSQDSNMIVGGHVFDTLVAYDAHFRLQPGLATDWRQVDEVTWEFSLRQGVSFHDGSPFDATDVVATFDRLREIPDRDGLYNIDTHGIRSVRAPNSRTVEVTTEGGYPDLPRNFVRMPIMRANDAWSLGGPISQPSQLVGTGPYRIADWDSRSMVILHANRRYWGRPPLWREVALRWYGGAEATLDAFWRKEVDVLSTTQPEVMHALRGEPDLAVSDSFSNRLTYIQFDLARQTTPFVRDRQGRPLDRNPFLDPRVRKAVSLAMDRRFLADVVLEGLGTPAGQLMPEGYIGHDPSIDGELAHDLARARGLLEEAGYKDGFAVTLHGPASCLLNGRMLFRAASEMLMMIGIEARFEVLPTDDFYVQATRGMFSIWLATWIGWVGEASYSVNGLLASRDSVRGSGRANRGGYVNERIDQLLAQANALPESGGREALLRQATRLGLKDLPLVPLIHRKAAWVTRAHIRHHGEWDGLPIAVKLTVKDAAASPQSLAAS